MKYHEGLAYLYQEKRHEAMREFQFILSERGRDEQFHRITPPQEVILGVLYHSGIAELQLGNFGRAVKRFVAAVNEMRRTGDFRLARGTVRHLGMALGFMARRAFGEAAEQIRHWLPRR
jgi:hypothetical protein